VTVCGMRYMLVGVGVVYIHASRRWYVVIIYPSIKTVLLGELVMAQSGWSVREIRFKHNHA